MIRLKTYNSMEESLAIMRTLTFVGGYINAYCFFTRGGAFGTFHTGNLVRTGISIVQLDWTGFRIAFLPILGAIIGGLLANWVKVHAPVDLVFQRRIIFTQFLVFFMIGFLRSDATDTLVNFIVPMVSMFQLTSFRKAGDRAHNSNIMTGNLRTFGQLLFNMIYRRDDSSTGEFLSYFLTMGCFVFGVILGGLISLQIGKVAVWFCALLMIVILVFSKNYQRG